MRGRPTTRFAAFRSRLRTGASFIDDEDYSDDLTADIINGLVEITGKSVEKLIDLRGWLRPCQSQLTHLPQRSMIPRKTNRPLLKPGLSVVVAAACASTVT